MLHRVPRRRATALSACATLCAAIIAGQGCAGRSTGVGDGVLAGLLAPSPTSGGVGSPPATQTSLLPDFGQLMPPRPGDAADGRATAMRDPLVELVSGTTAEPIRQPAPAATAPPEINLPSPAALVDGAAEQAAKLRPDRFAQDKLIPSNNRDWIPEHQVLAWAEREGDALTVHDIRNCEFYSAVDCVVRHYDKTYRLSDLRTVDFIMVPFNDAPALAHTMLSFGFAGGDYLAVSCEVRLEKGESYNPALGLLKQYELIYVVADERDVIRVRTEQRDCEVFVYRSTATPELAQHLLTNVLERANELHGKPEFYDTLSNNCTTNIVRHINHLAPNRVPYDYRVLLPGFADDLAYELGLIDNRRPLYQVREAARITDLAHRYEESPQFSTAIRGETTLRR